MKTKQGGAILGMAVLLVIFRLNAATLYVSHESANPAPPFSTWETAARTIQDAIDAANNGDTILVTNGVYDTGRYVSYIRMLNRVVIYKPVTVRSVNGPDYTFIVGASSPNPADSYGNGDDAIRCVWMTNGAVLSGFTISNGHTRVSGEVSNEQSGGGIFGTSTNAIVTNCVIRGNFANQYGGGVFGCTLKNCIVSENTAVTYYGGGVFRGAVFNSYLSNNVAGADGGGGFECNFVNSILILNNANRGGGAYNSSLINCTVAGNSAKTLAGGIRYGTAKNSIVYYNIAPASPNYADATFENSCTTPLPSGPANISNDPLLISLKYLLPNSPCIRRGAYFYVSGMDIDGEPWNNPPSMGADEFHIESIKGPLSVAIGVSGQRINASAQMQLSALIEGRTSMIVWDFADGTYATNIPIVTHSWQNGGIYDVKLIAFNSDNPGGVAATQRVMVGFLTFYVNRHSKNPVYPYSTWETAANSIQDAINAAINGDVILVTNGVYNEGGFAVNGIMTNRVVINKAVTVKSVNGPDSTFIVGAKSPNPADAFGNGDGAIRCVWMTNGAILSGFTLTNGATRSYSGSQVVERCGGGIFASSTNAIVTNCIIRGNSAVGGGGAYKSTLIKCILANNVAYSQGGGALNSVILNTIVYNNSAAYGGGISDSYPINSTIVNNTASIYGGGISRILEMITVRNCIVYFNKASEGDNYYPSTVRFFNSCTDPLPLSGTNNISDPPLLSSIYHLSTNSPCIGKGDYSFTSGVDIDGEVWLNPPCIGADQVILENLTGELNVNIITSKTNIFIAEPITLFAAIDGKVSSSVWKIGNDVYITNSPILDYSWDKPGDYLVELTAYNNSFPDGISNSLLIHVEPTPVFYVNAESENPTPPYTNWSTAAKTIQDAIDVASDYSLIIVTNGIYNTGGRAVYGLMTNRVVIDKIIKVISVNGPAHTFIVGSSSTNPMDSYGNGDGAIRCVWMTNGAVLSGFTITNGHTRVAGDGVNEQGGGGVWGSSTKAIVTNCVIIRNFANGGGGAFRCTLKNCVVAENAANAEGGAANSSALYNCVAYLNSAKNGGVSYNSQHFNCTIVGNTARKGGGIYYGKAYNSIIYYNHAIFDENYSDSTLQYSCSYPLASGTNNIESEPLLTSVSHLSANSPCIGMGSSTYSSGVDIDGDQWKESPSIGSDEVLSTDATGELKVRIVPVTKHLFAGRPALFLALIEGRAYRNAWEYNGSIIYTNTPISTMTWSNPGNYLFKFTAFNEDFPEGVSATYEASVLPKPVFYVNAANSNPVAPYTNWSTAANTIQDAINMAYPGETILVTNGVYNTGEVAISQMLSTRVYIDIPVTVRSVNGPGVTFIEGASPTIPDPYGNGNFAMRCVWMTNGAVLSGFTITNGHTRYLGDDVIERSGGGVWAASTDAIVTNCVITGNSAVKGGGAFRATLLNCVISYNNVASNGGGGCESLLINSLVVSNKAGNGGGAYNSKLFNCTVVQNTADIGGGISSSISTNCIVYYNSGNDYPNYDTNSVLSSSCSTPLPGSGSGNISEEPQFVNLNNGDFRLLSSSPCLERGDNSVVRTDWVDLDGKPRIIGARVDIGAYEFGVAIMDADGDGMPDDWERAFGLNPFNPLDGNEDLDNDGMLNWQEFAAGTKPNDANETLKLSIIKNPTDPASLILTFKAYPDRNYILQKSLTLSNDWEDFSFVESFPATRLIIITNNIHNGCHYYRIVCPWNK